MTIENIEYETLADTSATTYRPRTNATIELSKLNATYADLYDRQNSLTSDIVRMQRDIENKEKAIIEIEGQLNDLRQKIVKLIGMEVPPCPK